MKKTFVLLVLVALLITPVAVFADAPDDPGKPEDVGFDEFGYNYKANIFVGEADGVDRVLDGTVQGDPTYANDKLVMKWNKDWDEGRFEGGDYEGAWENNNWNGKKPGGSGETWHYKIAESDDCGDNCIWTQFEVLQSHGTVGNEHSFEVNNKPGYGKDR